MRKGETFSIIKWLIGFRSYKMPNLDFNSLIYFQLNISSPKESELNSRIIFLLSVNVASLIDRVFKYSISWSECLLYDLLVFFPIFQPLEGKNPPSLLKNKLIYLVWKSSIKVLLLEISCRHLRHEKWFFSRHWNCQVNVFVPRMKLIGLLLFLTFSSGMMRLVGNHFVYKIYHFTSKVNWITRDFKSQISRINPKF